MNETPDIPDRSLIGDHRRQWHDCLYVYPVISRRSGGLSVGVNLNPNRQCTFDCVYCQIDRSQSRQLDFVDLDILAAELDAVLAEIASGAIWQHERFSHAPKAVRRVNDIAFSGDGEPTCHPLFDQAVTIAADGRDRAGMDDVKLVVITNSTALDRDPFSRAVPILASRGGQVWAKLDAGTQAYFEQINRPNAGLDLGQIVANIAAVSQRVDLLIQTLFLSLDGQGPSPCQLDAYIGRLGEILDAGGQINMLQLHTVARAPAQSNVRYLPAEILESIADRIRRALPDLPVTVYPGRDVKPMGL